MTARDDRPDDQDVTVLVVDDDPEVRATVLDTLAHSASSRVVAEAGDGREALRWLAQATTDVVLLDIRMPVLDGLATLAEIRRQHLAVRVLMLTTFGDTDYVRTAVSDGADGFLLKGDDPRDLIRAVEAPDGEASWFSPRVATLLAADVRRGAKRADAATRVRDQLQRLTPRERDVTVLVAQGHTNAEIAARLFLGESTVKSYVGSATRRVGVRNRVELAALVWAAERLRSD